MLNHFIIIMGDLDLLNICELLFNMKMLAATIWDFNVISIMVVSG